MLSETVERIRMLEKEYITIKTIKSSSLGITMLAIDGSNKLFIKKVLPMVGTVYEKLKDLKQNGIAKIFHAIEAPNFDFSFFDENGNVDKPPLVTYVIEEFVSGVTLQQSINQGKSFSEEELELLFKEIAQILIPLHKQLIIHRDIKPDNIMLAESGQLFLIDFGAARSFEYNSKASDTLLLGTKEFAAPEQYGVCPTDARTDIYTLGKVIRNLLPEDYQGCLKPVLDLCLEFDPARRLVSAEQLLKLLEHPSDKLNYVRCKAESGNAEAWKELGDIYKSGVLASKDMQQAFKCYAKAAELNNDEGIYCLAEFYECGVCTELAPSKAVELFRKAAALTNERAFQKLGWLYYAGYGVSADYNIAVYYFKKAMEGRDSFSVASGSYGIAVCMLNGRGLTKNVAEALKIIDNLAASNSGIGFYGLANIYERGEHREKNLVKAFTLYKQSVEAGYLPALAQVGKCYYYGLGVEMDYAQALYYFNKALEQNDKVAKAYLSIMYVYEDGVEQDCHKAYRLCRESAEQENNVACFFLANYFYKYGIIVEQNDRERFKWYKKAADRGYSDACNALGDCYAEGIGTTISINKAIECYKIAGRMDKAQKLEGRRD